MTDRLYPDDPGYEAARAALLAKAQRLNPRFRLAEPWERAGWTRANSTASARRTAATWRPCLCWNLSGRPPRVRPEPAA